MTKTGKNNSLEYGEIGARRKNKAIRDSIECLFDQIWYHRHKCRMSRIELGEDPGDPDINKAAIAAAKKAEKKYGKKRLGPWDDFELGMLHGKLSALRWVMGDNWDFLDT